MRRGAESLVLTVGLALGAGCARDLDIGAELRPSGAEDGGAQGGATSAESGTADRAAPGGATCVPAACEQRLYDCGDCIDNDADGLVDSDDPDCLGPCHNAEDTFYGSIPGQSGVTCNEDCYFDQDRGAGNDSCSTSHVCDPLSPEGARCPHDGAARECAGRAPQPAACLAVCGPLTPNGCDCFGCCSLPGAATPVWVGSTDDTGTPTCDLASAGDPTRCRPCTQDPSCLNPCEPCELCVGKKTLPAECGGGDCIPALCPEGEAACGLPCLPRCNAGYSCITGCCIAVIR